MAKHWGVSQLSIAKGLISGKSLNQILTDSRDKHTIIDDEALKLNVDNLGNQFESLNKLAKHYGLRVEVLRNRLESGWCLADALIIKPITIKNLVFKVEDHKGKQFNSCKELCEHYKIDIKDYRKYMDSYNSVRIAIDLAKKDARNTKQRAKRKKDVREMTDHTGRKFKSIKEMCEYHGISKA